MRLPASLEQAELFRIGISILLTIVATLVLWWLLARTAQRTRSNFQQLLRDINADQSADGETAFAATQRRLTALKLVVNSARYVLFIGAGLIILHQAGVKLDSLVLPAGFFGAALGLGAQNLVRDVVAGLFIIFEGQFAVGDVVSINNTLGVIEEVGLRVTRLRDDNGQIYYFPNGAITNVSKYPNRHVAHDLWVPYGGEEAGEETGEAALKAIKEALQAFDDRYHVLEALPSQVPLRQPLKGHNIIHLRLQVLPSRAVLVKEKLPDYLVRWLEERQMKAKEGALVEITNAPS